MRNDFWSSRVEGNMHMWQNIRSAADALVSNDLMLANAILEVSSVDSVLFLACHMVRAQLQRRTCQLPKDPSR